ncbi:N-acetyltransferase family protein [Salinisphaera sp. SPP-AMP-43]|uniref:GNAT family N-acetyltransferase n=1 Tax=Salinisphaera sp. SPP-AMP-43 TaxID=3121288 RepID=UPI003C6DBFF2
MTPSHHDSIVHIRRVCAADGPALARIYAPFVTDNAVSFEYDAPDAETMSHRALTTDAEYAWLIAEDSAGRCLGYAYAGAFRSRPAYDWTVETSAYLATDARGRGVGERLYRHLFATLAQTGYQMAIAAITLPNSPSLKFHERFGFTRIGVLEAVGYKFEQFHDVAYYQRPIGAEDSHLV